MLISVEKLVHFQCVSCTKWFSVADAPVNTKKEWFCPWCGVKSTIN